MKCCDIADFKSSLIGMNIEINLDCLWIDRKDIKQQENLSLR